MTLPNQVNLHINCKNPIIIPTKITFIALKQILVTSSLAMEKYHRAWIARAPQCTIAVTSSNHSSTPFSLIRGNNSSFLLTLLQQQYPRQVSQLCFPSKINKKLKTINSMLTIVDLGYLRSPLLALTWTLN